MNIDHTKGLDYTESLINRQSAWWKKLLDVQYPYRKNIQSLNLGFVLDIGCGIGRNLLHLNGNGVGVDHNVTSVNICKERGLNAYTNTDFYKSDYAKGKQFDSMLIAHVAEHITDEDLIGLVKEYEVFLKPNAKIVVITPQELGYKSDSTHVQFVDFEKVKNQFEYLGYSIQKQYSFPFPRIIGHIFKFNEFVSIASKKDN